MRRFMGLLAVVLLAGAAEGGELSFKLGMPPNLPAGEVKQLSVGYNSIFMMSTPIRQQLEAGMWTDTGTGRSGSGYGSYSLGLRASTSNFYAEILSGLGLITATDSQLGGHFQFMHDASVGMYGIEGAIIGLGYKHISSAGIYAPNAGRDFLYLRVAFPF